jgi:hypothetical protein
MHLCVCLCGLLCLLLFFHCISNVSIIRYTYCPLLPEWSVSPPLPLDPIYAGCKLSRSWQTTSLLGALGGIMVCGYTLLLQSLAICRCAKRGQHTRIAVCCCQCTGWLWFALFFVMGISFLFLGVVTYDLIYPFTWAPFERFLLSSAFSLVFEFGALLLLFTVSYHWQRCRGTWDEYRYVGIAHHGLESETGYNSLAGTEMGRR